MPHFPEKRGGCRAEFWGTLEFCGWQRRGPDWTGQNIPAVPQVEHLGLQGCQRAKGPPLQLDLGLKVDQQPDI